MKSWSGGDRGPLILVLSTHGSSWPDQEAAVPRLFADASRRAADQTASAGEPAVAGGGLALAGATAAAGRCGLNPRTTAS